jgi:hypothetical protein
MFLATVAVTTGGAYLGALGAAVFSKGMPLSDAFSATSWVVFPGFFLGVIGARHSPKRTARETRKQEAASAGSTLQLRDDC